MRDYAFELTYTDGYRVTLKVSQPDRYKAWLMLWAWQRTVLTRENTANWK